MVMLPSPTPAATRLIDPWRTSPAAKTPGTLGASGYVVFGGDRVEGVARLGRGGGAPPHRRCPRGARIGQRTWRLGPPSYPRRPEICPCRVRWVPRFEPRRNRRRVREKCRNPAPPAGASLRRWRE